MNFEKLSIEVAIVQIHPLGCGLACVAFVLQEPYRQVYETLIEEGFSLNLYTRGLYRNNIVDILSFFGLRYRYKRLKNGKEEKFTPNTIVYIEPSERYPYGHYLAYAEDNLWMDPWINLTVNPNLAQAQAGFRKRLPGKPRYSIFPVKATF